MKKIISFNIATYPPRREYLKQVINDVYDKVDVIRVCLNNYNNTPDYYIFKGVPKFLKRPKIITHIPKKDLKDSGKFLWANENRNEIYFTGDDDLLYSEIYFENHMKKLKEYGNKKVFISSHGRMLSPTATKLTDIIYHKITLKNGVEKNIGVSQCRFDVPVDIEMNVGGTGVMCFDLSKIKFDINSINCIGCADLGLGLIASKNKIPILVRAHKRSELKYILNINHYDTLYQKRDFQIQLPLIKEICMNYYNLNV